MVTFTSGYKDIGIHLPQWTNLYEVFQSAWSATEVPGVQIIPDPACEELDLFCDPMLMKVFHQLIDNSLRHGKTVSRISLQWRSEGGNATILYEDNGCGIDASFKPVLFQRVNGKTTGYGMFLVNEILATSGFTITETGTAGKGVRFEIVIPMGSFRIVKPKQQ